MIDSKKIYNVKQRWILGWIPLVLVTCFIIRSAVTSPPEIPRFLFEINDKFLHFMQYFILFPVAVNAFRKNSVRLYALHENSLAIVYGFFLGSLTEWLQRSVPGRSPELGDWIANGAGTLVSLVVLLKIQGNRDAIL